MRKAEGPNWCSLCQAKGQRTLHIVNRGMDDRMDGWREEAMYVWMAVG